MNQKICSPASCPPLRVSPCNAVAVDCGGDYVLYWMIAARRTVWNFALQHAIDWAGRLGKPLVILEALRAAYPWKSERLDRFVLQGMADNARRLASTTALYYPYVEPKSGHAKGLLQALATHAAIVVTDEFPCFFLPRMVAAAAGRIAVCMEQVDSNGLLPLRAAPREYPTAYAFRRFLQQSLPEHLMDMPRPDPFRDVALPRMKSLPRGIEARWPRRTSAALDAFAKAASEPHASPSIPRGGSRAGAVRLRKFVRRNLEDYAGLRNEPEQEAASGLSPYLHFGNVSAHQIFAEVCAQQEWTPARLALRPTGSRSGWWGMSPSAEAFLDQTVTWRELAFNFCHHRRSYDRFESLPPWAKKTLLMHSRDERLWRYSLKDFARARTHDPLWNAAQMQLVSEGRIHNYLRMLWGKKILEWTRSPREALRIMIELNNRYAFDGRDPNSYAGIFWCLGRYDRPWGPERAIFGQVRYMSSRNTARKVSVRAYIARYAPKPAAPPAAPGSSRKVRPRSVQR